MRRIACALFALVALAAPASASAKPKSVPFGRAVTIASWGPTAYEPAKVAAKLRNLKKRQHVDTITLIVVWNQPNSTSVDIAPGPEAEPDANVVAAIRAARRLHMRVILRPYIDPLDGVWRGQIQPTSVSAWFKSYNAFILHYATIAQKQHADGFVVGSELATMAKQASQWRSLIRRVRSRFSGFLTYQANWGGEETNVTWWDALDAISISAYYPIAAAPGASVDTLVAGWFHLIDRDRGEHRWFATIEYLHNRYDRPVMFGEIGYRPVPEAAIQPWNVELTGSDPSVQANAYDAAFRVWYRVPWFRGMSWWYVAPDQSLVAGRPGELHQPGPAALRVLARWYAKKP